MPPAVATSFQAQRQRFVSACLVPEAFDAGRAYTTGALGRLEPLCRGLCAANVVEAVKELVLLSRYLQQQGFAPAAGQLMALGKACVPKARRRQSAVASESSFA